MFQVIAESCGKKFESQKIEDRDEAFGVFIERLSEAQLAGSGWVELHKDGEEIDRFSVGLPSVEFEVDPNAPPEPSLFAPRDVPMREIKVRPPWSTLRKRVPIKTADDHQTAEHPETDQKATYRRHRKDAHVAPSVEVLFLELEALSGRRRQLRRRMLTLSVLFVTSLILGRGLEGAAASALRSFGIRDGAPPRT